MIYAIVYTIVYIILYHDIYYDIYHGTYHDMYAYICLIDLYCDIRGTEGLMTDEGTLGSAIWA
jgi:hypothetical protein